MIQSLEESDAAVEDDWDEDEIEFDKLKLFFLKNLGFLSLGSLNDILVLLTHSPTSVYVV